MAMANPQSEESGCSFKCKVITCIGNAMFATMHLCVCVCVRVRVRVRERLREREREIRHEGKMVATFVMCSQPSTRNPRTQKFLKRP